MVEPGLGFDEVLERLARDATRDGDGDDGGNAAWAWLSPGAKHAERVALRIENPFVGAVRIA